MAQASETVKTGPAKTGLAGPVATALNYYGLTLIIIATNPSTYILIHTFTICITLIGLY